MFRGEDIMEMKYFQEIESIARKESVEVRVKIELRKLGKWLQRHQLFGQLDLQIVNSKIMTVMVPPSAVIYFRKKL